MEAAGQQRIVRAEDVAHMGLTEILRHALYIHSQYRALVRAIKHDRPALAILIDFPDVNFRLAMHCKRLGVAVLWFVSPQLWAWKRRRLRWVQRFVDRMLVIFPFEAEFYRARGVDVEFVGHPLATLPLHMLSREVYATAHGLDPAKHWIALLPGSRWSEISKNLPAMLDMAVRFPTGCEYLIPCASTIEPTRLQELITAQLSFWHREVDPRMLLPTMKAASDAREALFHARASIVASGTATVQALTIGNPFVVVYRVSALSFAILKRLIRYPAEIPAQADADGNLPIAMPNLIAGRRIVTELLNQRFTATNLAAAIEPLLADTPARARMIADLAEARAKLLPAPGANPIHRVCAAAETLLRSDSP
jgi:lipid-A-disaccharide synthase